MDVTRRVAAHCCRRMDLLQSTQDCSLAVPHVCKQHIFYIRRERCRPFNVSSSQLSKVNAISSKHTAYLLSFGTYRVFTEYFSEQYFPGQITHQYRYPKASIPTSNYKSLRQSLGSRGFITSLSIDPSHSQRQNIPSHQHSPCARPSSLSSSVWAAVSTACLAG
ncbi:hypothetical protein CC86DRAFT_2098 [Ophiobolus disseminans]|uniref:Uncharacterized protein n=1 Tax=Ophiobolus disseminans TaxID=1469910 RepID=A0A6A7AI04_9PLEO|nr:hypothetical protein CC86DRAFT_2098 [Ophiobolus disseminans]